MLQTRRAYIFFGIDDKEFDDLFVVTIYAKGKAKVVRLKYGNKS